MSLKSSLLALAAATSLGAFALTSTDALAYGGRLGLVGGTHLGPTSGLRLNPGGLHYGGGHDYRFRRIVRVPPRWWWPHHHHLGWWHWPRPYWVAPVVTTGVVASYAPTYSRCTCLTKAYTPEGAVVFKDTCTNEMAMNPPESGEPAPQQQSYVQQPNQAQ